MADYQKMYTIPCRAIDSAIDLLELLPEAEPEARRLRRALLEAEEVYIATTEDEVSPSAARE